MILMGATQTGARNQDDQNQDDQIPHECCHVKVVRLVQMPLIACHSAHQLNDS